MRTGMYHWKRIEGPNGPVLYNRVTGEFLDEAPYMDPREMPAPQTVKSLPLRACEVCGRETTEVWCGRCQRTDGQDERNE